MLLDKIYTSLREVNRDLSAKNSYLQFASSAVTVGMILGHTFSLMTPWGGALYGVIQLGALKTGVKLFCTAEKVDGTWNHILVIIQAVVIPSCISYVVVAIFTPVSLISLVALPLTTFLLAHVSNSALEKVKRKNLANYIKESLVGFLKLVDENNATGRSKQELKEMLEVGELVADELSLGYDLDYTFKDGIYKGRTIRDLFTDVLDENKTFQKLVKFYTGVNDDTSRVCLDKVNNELFPTIRNILNIKTS